MPIVFTKSIGTVPTIADMTWATVGIPGESCKETNREFRPRLVEAG